MIMQHNNINRIIQITLFIVCIGLGSMLFMELRAEYSSVDRKPVLGSEDIELLSLPSTNDEFPPITTYQEIVSRPLFTNTRRPNIPEEITVKVDVSRKIASEQYLLSAVVITKNKRIALIQSNRIKEPQKVALGEILDGWILSDIQPRQITLERNGEIKKLELEIIPSPKLAVQNENLKHKSKDREEMRVAVDENGEEEEYEEEYEDDPD